MVFAVGNIVVVRADQSRIGPVVEVLPAVDGLARYRVFHAPGNIRDYAEDQLVPAPPEPVGDQVLLDAEEFRTGLTAARLRHPLTDHIYALRAARIQYVPFQFRPLLRLARADEPRLLIADDVGVGKTIEAGLILKELAARQPLETVLVVCSKALVVKWREEMRRFDEEFRILDAASLRYCLNEAEVEGRWPQEYRRSIVHYELMRLDPYLRGEGEGRRRRVGLFDLDPAPHFDLVIADEAHHVRTPGTNGHLLAEYLSEASTAMLLLSATPIQTSSRDLFTLLRLLRPDLFPEPQSLADMLEPNRYLTAAARVLRQAGDGSAQQAARYLELAAATGWGTRTLPINPRYQTVRARLDGQPQLTGDERVRCVTDIEELNLLSHLVNRTRRRDIGPFTLREPHTVAVPFTPAQQELYDRLIQARRDELLLRHDPTAAGLVLVTLERQAASCLPALAARLATGETLTAQDLTDAPEAEGDARDAALPADLQLRALARALPADDPKFDRLLRIARSALAADGPGKVLVFSFFLSTLDYLAERLASAGVRVGLVTGRTDEVERESLRDRFRADRADPDALDALLSSEVGCEGLDYEFCDRLVNYDIPWNPMRVEQRIGRIDRFGQRSPKVLVFNFVTPGTVEERVFHRCWERLGLFQDTLGDLEGVLGDVVQDLNNLLASTELTPSQVDERARQLADNAVRLAEETRNVDEAAADLLGLDDSLTRDLDDLVAQGRAVTEQQLEELLRAFLAAPPLQGTLQATSDTVRRIHLNKAARTELAGMLEVRPSLLAGRPGRQLRDWLAGGGPGLPVTFSVDEATNHRSLAFVTATHPLIRLAVASLAPRDGHVLAARLEVADASVPAGEYAFAVHAWETIAARPEVCAVGFAVHTATLAPAPAVERLLLALLAGTATMRTPPGVAFDKARDVLDAHAEQRRRAAATAAAETSEVYAAGRLASLDAHHQRVAQRLDERVTSAAEPRIARMRAAQRERVEQDYRRRRRDLEERRGADIVSHRITEGVLRVIHDQ
ncbi:SNF2-related protein [Micromonospora cremea]|uniref:Helicase conserved C-terminal domain-containing protein n=1 Tax=Micromonospora cremea TaxID=709881 RepID=A0A1N5TYE3_9ACTN|nr:SNF2-related protein [Micromonospora cremea]SIM53534.1 Helicase conserved C-terminal domain-containing protein [Micromonospora cremea]